MHKRRNILINWMFCFTICTIVLLTAASIQAAPLAGSVISNQASASYSTCLDSSCSLLSEQTSVTSNLVETVVQAVPYFVLENDQNQPAVSGQPVNFPHILTNMGNVTDSYSLCIGSVDAAVSEWALFIDENSDGVADQNGKLFSDQDADANGCWLQSTRDLDPGDVFNFVIVAIATGTQGSSIEPLLDITATSNQDPSLSQTNTDNVVFPDGPVIEVVKAMSDTLGLSPSGPYTVTLRYRNLSTQMARNVLLEDVLPTQHTDVQGTVQQGGMTYVANSARWSLNDTTILTDSDDGIQVVDGEKIAFCAYSANCVDRVTAKVSSVPAGVTATLSFQVTVESGISNASRIFNTADYAYEDELGSVFSNLRSNTVTFTVTDNAQEPGVVANNTTTDNNAGLDDSQNTGNIVESIAIEQGESAVFNNVIWNTGDGVDTFDITLDSINDRQGEPLVNPFPQGSVFQLLQSDNNTPLTDTSGSGIVDTGPIPIPDVSGQCPARFVSSGTACGVVVVLKATLPIDFSGLGPFDVTKRAISNTNSSVSNAVTDRLASITAASVDLTNDQPVAGDGSGPGEGQGPELNPVTTATVAPGENATFTLFVNNTSGRQDNYLLTVSDTDTPFTPGQLPAGWKVQFFNDGGSSDCSTQGQLISATATIVSGGNVQVCAIVTTPTSGEGGDSLDLFFRALSPTTGAQDIKRDRVVLVEQPAISITPDQLGQVEPGSGVVYTHQVRNSGNQGLESITLVGGPDISADGWSITLYEDTDGDGQWSPGDTIIGPTDILTTANGNAQLLPGEEVVVFARIFAPANAAQGDLNVKQLTVSAVTLANGTAVSDTASDTTTVTQSDVVIVKRQALDDNCDGTPDTNGFVLTRFNVMPGQCVLYQLTATNQGDETRFNVTLRDRTQPFTVYAVAGQACTNPDGSCDAAILAPVDGEEGDIEANVGGLTPGEQARLVFGVKVL
ncbi:hypothetical protein [Vibrio sp. ArtGut-C1]|uniref:COG1470 family protein n=1 Tax=Vibrio sp. ArtGut-C1 TaxID=2259137 RepID=UPI001C1F62AB|nr:hypothetical protein [Vibrio sp. ArtGut-C1]